MAKKSSLPQDIKQPNQDIAEINVDNTTIKKNKSISSFAVPPSGNLRKSGTEKSSITNTTKELDNSHNKELTMIEQDYEALRNQLKFQNYLKKSPTFRSTDEIKLIGESSDEESSNQDENLMFPMD